MKMASDTGDSNQTIKDEGRDETSTLTSVFNHLMQQVKESQQRKDEFIGIAFHELKTPLTTIKGYLELLQLMEDREPNKQFVQKALENTTKPELLIKDLLNVSNMQSGRLKLNKEPVDIGKLPMKPLAHSSCFQKHTPLNVRIISTPDGDGRPAMDRTGDVKPAVKRR